jgi:predicted DNA-binding transcriptional regulator AlpA
MSRPHSEAQASRKAAGSALSDESLITSKPLRELLGRCSEMHIWRLLNDEKNQALAFPRPFKINGRNYWRLGTVRQWIREREIQSQLAPTAALRAAPRLKPPAMPRNRNSRKEVRSSKRARSRRVRASERLRYLPDESQRRVYPMPPVVRRIP